MRTRLAVLSYNGEQPQLVFFLHDEVMVHTPAALAGDVTAAISSAADEAGRLLFGSFPVDFATSIACVDNYAEAKMSLASWCLRGWCGVRS